MLRNIFYVLKEQICCLIFLRKLRCTKQEKEIQNNVSKYIKLIKSDRKWQDYYFKIHAVLWNFLWIMASTKKKKKLFSIDACNTYFLSIKSAY